MNIKTIPSEGVDSRPLAMLVADVHTEYSVRSDNVRGVGVSILVLDVITEIVRRHRPKYLISLGDLFDAHGILESWLAVDVKSRFLRLCDELDVKIILMSGNHEWQEVRDEFFGRSILSALFSDLEHRGIYVIDKKARFLRLDEKTVFFGMPYRETEEQFDEACFSVFQKELSEGEILRKEDDLLMGWHVGVPFGNNYRVNEPTNNWMNDDSEKMFALFSRAHGRRIFCGHYHGPADLKCGKIGTITYVGSPATRSRSESGQDKRVGFWDKGKAYFESTHLDLDHVVSSVEQAESYGRKLVERFGQAVMDITRIHIVLPKEASLDDFNVSAKEAKRIGPWIKVDTPEAKVSRSMCAHIVDAHRADPSSSREDLETDLFRFTHDRHYRGESFKSLTDSTFQSLKKIPYRELKAAWRVVSSLVPKDDWKRTFNEMRQGAKEDADFDRAVSAVEALMAGAGIKAEDIGDLLSVDFIASAARFSLSSEVAEESISG